MTSVMPSRRQSSLLAALVLLAGIFEFSRPVNHDVAWVLAIGKLLRSNQLLYRDILEINPPLIFWIGAVIRGVSAVTPIHADTLFRVGVLGIGFCSALLVHRITRSLGVAVALILGGLILVGPDFGQRDPLIVFLLAPYAAMASVRSRPGLAWVIGLFAALAFCLKPFYLAVWLLLLPFNRARAADITIVITGLLYVGAVLILTPDYFPTVRLYGPLYRAWIHVPFVNQASSLVAILGYLVIALALLASRRAPKWTVGMALATLGSLIALFLQAKSFSYHQQPIVIFGLMASFGALVSAYRPMRLVAGILIFCLVANAAFLWSGSRRDLSPRARVRTSLEQIPDTVAVALLSQSLQHDAAFFGDLDREWPLPAPSLWWLDHTAHRTAPGAWDSLTNRTMNALACATVLAVDTSSYGFLRGIPPDLTRLLEARYRLIPIKSYPPLMAFWILRRTHVMQPQCAH